MRDPLGLALARPRPRALQQGWREILVQLQCWWDEQSLLESPRVLCAVIGAIAFLVPILSVPVARWSSLDPWAADLASDIGLGSYVAVTHNEPSSQFVAVARPFSTGGLVLDEEAEPERLRVRTARLEAGKSVTDSLESLGVPETRREAILAALQPVFDLGSSQEGDFVALSASDSGELISFEYQRGRDLYRVTPSPSGKLLALHSEPPMERRVVTLGGVVTRSLFDSLRDQGERPELVQAYADIFAWQIDFTKEVRPGDEYRLVYEKFYDRSGFVRYGRILAAQYSPQLRQAKPAAPLTALYYEDTQGFSGYYTPTGDSLQGSLLRAPVNYTRISSKYAARRLHPVHRVYKPHLAVDYAAPVGTPIWAAGDGIVIFKGWRGGLGRAVKIRHRNGFVSYYGHLSRYADGLKVGDQVRQKQVVGYVGMTGTATGPHLDYRLQFKGRFVDPLKVSFEPDRAIPDRERFRFAEVREQRLEYLQKATPPVLLEAAM